jgi:dihydrofolate reductase
VVAGRNTYDDANGWGGGGPHPTAPLFVVSDRPAPLKATSAQRFATSIEQAVRAARTAAGDLDVPVLLGAGRRLFQELPAHVRLSLVEAVPAPGVTHLHYRLQR